MEDWKNDEIQTILRYNWARGLTPSECIVEMQPSTGDNCPNHEVISRRFENFDSNDSEARAIMSNTSGAQIDPLQVNVEGQVAERKQQIDFGRPIEAENGKEKNADAKENFENSSENDPVMKFAVPDGKSESVIFVKEENHTEETKKNTDSRATGAEVENSVYSVVKSESAIDITHEIISAKTENDENNPKDDDVKIEVICDDDDDDEDDVKIEEIVEDSILSVVEDQEKQQSSSTVVSSEHDSTLEGTEKRFACKHCGKTYKNKHHANRHMYYECQMMKSRKNKKWKKYFCEDCKRSFTSKYSLERHQFFLHSGVSNKVSCGTCRQTFVNDRGLASHLKKKNCGGALIYHFICNVCNRKYRDGSSLKRHKLNECGKEPKYKCAHCTYRTLQKVNLIRHLARLHGSEKTNFPCPKCKRSYKNECTLKRHLDVECGREKLELCNLCNYKTKRKSCLTSHMLNKHSTSN